MLAIDSVFNGRRPFDSHAASVRTGFTIVGSLLLTLAAHTVLHWGIGSLGVLAAIGFIVQFTGVLRSLTDQERWERGRLANAKLDRDNCPVQDEAFANGWLYRYAQRFPNKLPDQRRWMWMQRIQYDNSLDFGDIPLDIAADEECAALMQRHWRNNRQEGRVVMLPI
jgi:hypothetical protein